MTLSRTLTVLSGLAIASAATAYRSSTFTLDNSEIYPDTTHDVIVTLSENYRPDSSAVLYLGLDGILCNAPAVFDSLSTAGVIPPVVGVYLQPGIIKDDTGERVLRYNRSNEFDAITPWFAEFIEREVLPAVSKHDVNWSPDPEKHLIFGLSSGGIAAFNAAWHRPEMWGKVFSGCGTFVPMRGGEEIQVLVRKSEPRHIKVVLQDGFSDTWNPLFGSWYEANRMLASALEFAGYDCRFDWAEGGHSVRRATEIFPETVTWLLSESTQPRPTDNNLLSQLLIEGCDWQETPTTETLRKEIPFVLDYPGGGLRVHKHAGSNVLWQTIVSSTGEDLYLQPFYWLHSIDGEELAIGGMAFDSDGNLWVVTPLGIQILDQNGRVRGILRMPEKMSPAKTIIELTDGMVTLSDRNHTYRRRVNTAPGTTLPRSQGQG